MSHRYFFDVSGNEPNSQSQQWQEWEATELQVQLCGTADAILWYLHNSLLSVLTNLMFP